MTPKDPMEGEAREITEKGMESYSISWKKAKRKGDAGRPFKECMSEQIASALHSAYNKGLEDAAKVAEDMTKEQEYKTIGHYCENRCEWEREWTKKIVASAIRQLMK